MIPLSTGIADPMMESGFGQEEALNRVVTSTFVPEEIGEKDSGKWK